MMPEREQRRYAMKSAGLYIHFPFCIKKCNYCDFLSFPVAVSDSFCMSSEELFASYIECMKNELLFRQKFLTDTKIQSIFFGGGTPSLIPPDMLTDLLTLIRRIFPVQSNAEITVECNPGTLSDDKLYAMYAAGITRLSIGLQTTQNDELSYIGRIHTYEQFLDNYHKARKTGFKNINIDLMSALPGQTVMSYQQSLQNVIDLKPEHISAYSLIIEDGTPFEKIYGEAADAHAASSLPGLPSEDDERLMYDLTGQLLGNSGYHRYEISNYARDGYECRHNIIYWTRKNYLGIGLGSASLIDRTRFSNIRDLEKYMSVWGTKNEGSDLLCGTENAERLTIKDEMEEFMFLGLRMTGGIWEKDFTDAFGRPFTDVYGAVIEKHIRDKTLIYDNSRLRLTKKGLDVANYVMSDFIL